MVEQALRGLAEDMDDFRHDAEADKNAACATNMCMICSKIDGEVDGQTLVQVRGVMLLRPPHNEALPVCNVCVSRMPMDPHRLREAARMAGAQAGASDDMVREFVRQFVERLWTSRELPSWQLLADALNACSLWSPNGRAWSCANLMQKAARMGLRREDFALDPEAARRQADLEVAQAMPLAEAWLASRTAARPSPAGVPAPEGMPGFDREAGE